MSGQRHAPAARYHEKDPVPIVQEAGWAPGPVWTGTENLAPPPGFDPRTIQPVASRYTDYATRPTIMKVIWSKEIYVLLCPLAHQLSQVVWVAASVLCDKVAGLTRHDKTDTCSIYLTHCGNSSKTLKKIAGLRAKISNWLLLNTIQDSILNFVESKKRMDQHQMLISFNLGKLPVSADFQYRKNYYKACLITDEQNGGKNMSHPTQTLSSAMKSNLTELLSVVFQE